MGKRLGWMSSPSGGMPCTAFSLGDRHLPSSLLPSGCSVARLPVRCCQFGAAGAS